MREACPELEPLKLTDKMPFGKYEGISVTVLLDVKPGYLRWWNANMKPHLDKEVIECMPPKRHREVWFGDDWHWDPSDDDWDPSDDDWDSWD